MQFAYGDYQACLGDLAKKVSYRPTLSAISENHQKIPPFQTDSKLRRIFHDLTLELPN